MTTLAQVAEDAAAAVLAATSGYHLSKTPVVKHPVKTVRTKIARKYPVDNYTMYDQLVVNPATLPRDGDVYLAYVDGEDANLKQMRAFVNMYAPHARILTCTRDHTYLAEMYDVEKGAGTGDTCQAWFELCREHGIYRPVFYGALEDENGMLAIKAAINDLPRWAYRLVYADWNGQPTILAGYNGHQYQTGAYDKSVLGRKFFPPRA